MEGSLQVLLIMDVWVMLKKKSVKCGNDKKMRRPNLIQNRGEAADIYQPAAARSEKRARRPRDG